MKSHSWINLALLVLAASQTACGGGIPVRLRIDEFTMELALDDLVDQALADFKGQGLFPAETEALPELWPQSLPDIKYRALLAAPPVPVDLTPEDTGGGGSGGGGGVGGGDGTDGLIDPEKYEMINKAEAAINRIELNRLILRIEQSTLSIALPELRFQVADEPDADPNDRLAWETIGRMPTAEPGFIGDIEFTFDPGGETYLNNQLMDEKKEFAMRVRGTLELDTEQNPRLPSGAAAIRLILVATFFVDPEGAVGAAGDLAGGVPAE